MPFLSPAKLLVILVIALVVLGPDKLPKVAKQVGTLWGDFRTFREKLESDVRGSFPDLPSSQTITHAVRSPLSFLDGLAEAHGSEGEVTSGTSTRSGPSGPSGAVWDVSGTSGPSHVGPLSQNYEMNQPLREALLADPGDVVHEVRFDGVDSDDPGMN
jgi:TatA/E family protein of Tat protein translocase